MLLLLGLLKFIRLNRDSGSAYDQVTIKGKFFGTKKGKVYLEYGEGANRVIEGCKV